MFHLVYTSHAVVPFQEEDLIALLRKSREYNQKHGITGMLLYIQGKFMQVLEGDQEEVLALYLKIKADPRHRKVATIVEGQSDNRVFREWSMGFKMLTDEEATALGSFSLDHFFADKEHAGNQHLLMVFLQMFYARNISDFAVLK